MSTDRIPTVRAALDLAESALLAHMDAPSDTATLINLTLSSAGPFSEQDLSNLIGALIHFSRTGAIAISQLAPDTYPTIDDAVRFIASTMRMLPPYDAP